MTGFGLLNTFQNNKIQNFIKPRYGNLETQTMSKQKKAVYQIFDCAEWTFAMLIMHIINIE